MWGWLIWYLVVGAIAAGIVGIVKLRQRARRKAYERRLAAIEAENFAYEHEERTWVWNWRLRHARPPLSFLREYEPDGYFPRPPYVFHEDVGRLHSLLGFSFEVHGWQMYDDGIQRYNVAYFADLRAFQAAVGHGALQDHQPEPQVVG